MFNYSIIFSQHNDSTKIEEFPNKLHFEMAGMSFKLYGALHLHANLSVNLPAKKKNWYTNVALSINKIDYAQNGGGNTNFISFSTGKNYQFFRRNFYTSVGMNVGIFYFDWFSGNPHVSSRTLGLATIPRLEFGLNKKKIVLSTGLYFAIGAGIYKEFYYNQINEVPEWYRINGAASPYFKIIFK